MKFLVSRSTDDQRSAEQIVEHYELEKRLANRLKNSTKSERQTLYIDLYNELFGSLPHHPQHVRNSDAAATQTEIANKMKLLSRFLDEDTIYLELGPGDCRFALEAGKQVRKVYAVDVSDEITKNKRLPKNFTLIISDGCSVPVNRNSVSVAYSNQLMEHLHPDDAEQQLREVYSCLKPGGSYVCITPNKFSGPHDVSKYFDREAMCFHLKEYTNIELVEMFKNVGFSKITTYMGGQGFYYRCPTAIAKFVEKLMAYVPLRYRYMVGNFLPIKALLGVIIVGIR